MTLEQAQALVRRVSGVCGIKLATVARSRSAVEDLDFRISGLEEPNGVGIRLFRTAMGLAARSHFDLFSQDLVQRAEKTFSESPGEVMFLLDSVKKPASVEVLVNGSALDKMHTEQAWNKLDFRWFVPDVETKNEWELAEELLAIAVPVLFDFLTGFGSPAGLEYLGEVEGTSISGSCGRYKRSAANRVACLQHFGAVCMACGLRPETTYGDEGPSIIHVHHLVPLSAMEVPKALSPIEDLVPLCPNCHNFAHKRNPPYTPEEIRAKITP